MTQPTNYRNKAQAVRSAAREVLIQLREERLAKRRDLAAARGNVVTTQSVQFLGIDRVLPDTRPDLTIPDGPALRPKQDPFSVYQSVGSGEDIAAIADVTDPDDDDPFDAPDAISDSASEPAEALIDAADAGADAPGLMAMVTEDTEGATPLGAVTLYVEEDSQTDLSQLPGVGVGLVWMLQQCDIFTLEDLAVANAELLSEKLGVVGQILNVQTWIDFAQTDRAA